MTTLYFYHKAWLRLGKKYRRSNFAPIGSDANEMKKKIITIIWKLKMSGKQKKKKKKKGGGGDLWGGGI